jgi:hypothetical protein
MKLFLHILIHILIINLNAQAQEPPAIADPLERAIREFYKPFEEQDFSTSIDLLENLKTKYPDNTEIRYFLGYAYDRFNCKDGKTIPEIKSNLTRLASEEFEFIIHEEPKYTKRKLILDPYSKITAIWGSLALKYYYNSNIDSVKFALVEGKKRGGFSDALLEIGEKVLNSCTMNSILFVSGDNFSFPILYNQIINNYRTDVQVIDISLLNTDWYCSLIKNTTSISFLKDSIDFQSIPVYAESDERFIIVKNKKCQSAGNFEWEIDNFRSGKYIVKSDSILKMIVITNKFLNDIYFTLGQNKDDLLSLYKYVSNGLFVSKLEPCEVGTEEKAENLQFKNNTLSKESTRNSEDILRTIDVFRYNYSFKINEKIDELDFKSARMLLNEMEIAFPEEFVPIQNESLKSFIDELKIKASR